MDAEEIRQMWLESPDRNVVQAASIDKDGYPPEIQHIINEEVRRRNLEAVVEQQIALSKAKAEAQTRQREKRRLSYRLSQAGRFIVRLTEKKILISMAVFVCAVVLASYLAGHGYRMARPVIMVLGLVEMSVVILIESKNRLGRSLWGWAITTFVICLILAWFIGVLKPNDHFKPYYTLGQLLAFWTLGLSTYGSFVADQEYDRRSGVYELQVRCPNCNRKLEGATERMVGDMGVCPKCKTEFEIRRTPNI